MCADDRRRGEQSHWLSWGEALCRKDDGEHESFGIPDLLHHGAQAAERRLLQLAAKAGMVWRTCHRRASALNPFEQPCLALTFQFDPTAPDSRGYRPLFRSIRPTPAHHNPTSHT